MATPLYLMVDDALEPPSRAMSRHAAGLLGAMIASTPRGIQVVGFASSTTPPRDDDEIRGSLPGLKETRISRLSHRQLAAVWQHGFTAPLGGMTHSPSLFAPLTSGRDQTVVTVHDAVPWLEPATVEGSASWFRNMAKRADRYADAVVVPSHAVADQLNDLGLFAGRIHVIPGAASPGLVAPDGAADRRRELGIPDRYLASTATLNPRKGLSELLSAVGNLRVPLVLLGDPEYGDSSIVAASAEAGIDEGLVHVVNDVSAADRAAILAGADIFVEPSRLEGFGIDVLDAMTAGAPVVTTDDPALVELVVDAARIVPRGDDLVSSLRDAIDDLWDDRAAAERLTVAGQDRARAFSWAAAAEKVWELHADL
jgi:glycosyltransferase involved in cell wall biosynthesis